jgi:hypothetical protein
VAEREKALAVDPGHRACGRQIHVALQENRRDSGSGLEVVESVDVLAEAEGQPAPSSSAASAMREAPGGDSPEPRSRGAGPRAGAAACCPAPGCKRLQRLVQLLDELSCPKASTTLCREAAAPAIQPRPGGRLSDVEHALNRRDAADQLLGKRP